MDSKPCLHCQRLLKQLADARQMLERYEAEEDSPEKGCPNCKLLVSAAEVAREQLEMYQTL